MCGSFQRLLPVTLLLAAASLQAQTAWGARPDGSAVTSLAEPAARAVVLFFVASDCPVSNRTFPEMQRVRTEFSTRGVQFWFVYPNSGETPAGVATHQSSFDAGGSALIATGPELVRLAGAVATPEVSVLKADGHGGWKPVFTGRVDNRFVRFGQERPQATEHFAEQAVTAVLAGQTPPKPVGTPVGCAIMNPGARPQ